MEKHEIEITLTSSEISMIESFCQKNLKNGCQSPELFSSILQKVSDTSTKPDKNGVIPEFLKRLGQMVKKPFQSIVSH